jgi:hyperosmotically inducible protein
MPYTQRFAYAYLYVEEEMKSIKNFAIVLAGALMLSSFAQAAVSVGKKTAGLTKLENEVRHELVMMPWFGVFDNLEFQVNGREVVLMGQVTRPTLRSDAERLVKRIEGVERVVNNIEVLPLSPFDNDIRRATYYAIFGYGPLGRYSWGPVPPIHIIVKNGHVTLEGVVANETDKNIAGIRANSVAGVFSVTNDLRVENSRS